MSDETPPEADAVAATDGQPAPAASYASALPSASAERPELPVAAAFVGGLALALLLKRRVH